MISNSRTMIVRSLAQQPADNMRREDPALRDSAGQDLSESFLIYHPPLEAHAPLPVGVVPIPLGTSKPRGMVHRDGDWHRSVHVWLASSSTLLMQMRSDKKDTFPSRWDVSCAGHMSGNDGSLETAVRELEEELGLCIDEAAMTSAFVCTIPAGRGRGRDSVTWSLPLPRVPGLICAAAGRGIWRSGKIGLSDGGARAAHPRRGRGGGRVAARRQRSLRSMGRRRRGVRTAASALQEGYDGCFARHVVNWTPRGAMCSLSLSLSFSANSFEACSSMTTSPQVSKDEARRCKPCGTQGSRPGAKKRTNARQDPTAGPRTAHAHVQHQQTGQRHDNDGKSL